ncbi:MAG: hypothetical protein ACM3YM_02815 [Sphingomonadales bacterium]
MTDVPAELAKQDQAQAMAAQCAPILYAAFLVAYESTNGAATVAGTLLDQATKDGWSALEAMALAVEMMRRLRDAERKLYRLDGAVGHFLTMRDREQHFDAMRKTVERIMER